MMQVDFAMVEYSSVKSSWKVSATSAVDPLSLTWFSVLSFIVVASSMEVDLAVSGSTFVRGRCSSSSSSSAAAASWSDALAHSLPMRTIACSSFTISSCSASASSELENLAVQLAAVHALGALPEPPAPAPLAKRLYPLPINICQQLIARPISGTPNAQRRHTSAHAPANCLLLEAMSILSTETGSPRW